MAHYSEATMLDSRPLLRALSRQIDNYGSLNRLAGHICHKMNLSQKDCATTLSKLRKKERITLFAADRYATALGYHIIELWGFAEYSKGIDMERDG